MLNQAIYQKSKNELTRDVKEQYCHTGLFFYIPVQLGTK